MKQKKGVTLIELLIAMVLLTIMMISFTNVYTFGMKTYGEQFAQSRLNSEAQTIIDRISTDVNSAKSIEQTYTTYSSDDSSLILKVPAIDSSQNFVYSGGGLVYDYFIYYLSGSTLHRVTFAAANSARYDQNNQDKELSTKVTGLTFEYDPELVGAIGVQTSITLSQPTGKVTKSVTLTGKSTLRNNL